MRILIGVPCMDMVHARFAQSIATMNRPEGCIFCFSIGSLVQQSRDAIARQAIELEADYILWLDSDMIFEPTILEKLLADQKELVGGLYLKREPPYFPTAFIKIEPEAISTPEWPSDLFEIAGIGFGCMLTKVSVLKDILQKEGELFAPIGHQGEDISFCIRANRNGYKVFCDPNIECGHIGNIVITKQIFHK